MIPIFSLGFIQVATKRVGVETPHTFVAVSIAVTTLPILHTADTRTKAGESHPLKIHNTHLLRQTDIESQRHLQALRYYIAPTDASTHAFITQFFTSCPQSEHLVH